MSKNERIILFLLAALNFTNILDFMIMMPLGNYLMPYFNITPQQFSLLVASYTLSASISGFCAAFFVDGFDRKKVLLFAYIGFLVATFACGFAPTYIFLLFSTEYSVKSISYPGFFTILLRIQASSYHKILLFGYA